MLSMMKYIQLDNYQFGLLPLTQFFQYF